MKRWIAILLLSVSVAAPLGAAIDAPDHVIYGNATLFGNPVPIGQAIEARSLAGETLVRHELGRDTRLGGQYALRMPMDAINPRQGGFARPGDPIEIFIGSQLAARTVVGAVGTAVRLDIDPQLLGTGPSVTVSDVEVFEGNVGLTQMVFPASMNTTSSDVVSVTWQTVNDSAVGGAQCGPGVDFIASTGQLSFQPGNMTGQIVVNVCANTIIEPTRQLRLQFVGVENGVLAQGEVTGTIVDDDDIPELRMADVTVIKPVSGQTSAAFRPILSKTSDYEVRFTYFTEDLTAIAGVDYSSLSGAVTIPAGELSPEQDIIVPILSGGDITPPRDFLVRLGNPFNVEFARTAAIGRISDARFDPVAELAQEVVDGDGDIIELAGPTALAIAPDGEHVYVTSQTLNAVALFARNRLTGRLDWIELFDNDHPDMTGAGIDGPMDVQLSPDGLNAYLASARNESVIVLSRDPATGALAFLERIDGTLQAGLGGVRKLLVSPDGRHVYAAGAQSNAVVVFARDLDQGGRLAVLEVESNCLETACAGRATSLVRPSGLAMSLDGDQVYVASRTGNSVQVYVRQTDVDSPDFGQLSLIAEYRSGLAGIVDLSGAFGIEVSPDNAQVYVSAEGEDAVAVFDRNSDGTLAQRSTLRHASPELPGLRGPQGLALSPSGDRLYAAGFADSTLSIFDRLLTDDGDRSIGDLDIRQTLFDDQGGIDSMRGPTRVVASDDDRHIYVVANTDNAIVVLRRLPIRDEDDRIFSDGFGSPP